MSIEYRILEVGETIQQGDQWTPTKGPRTDWSDVTSSIGWKVKSVWKGEYRRPTPAPTREQEPKCPRCNGQGWVFMGHGEDYKCDCSLGDGPPETTSDPFSAPTTISPKECSKCGRFTRLLHLDGECIRCKPTATDQQISAVVKVMFGSDTLSAPEPSEVIPTPRTDSQGLTVVLGVSCVAKDFARTLERELTQTSALLDKACHDWADDDTAIKEIAERHGINTDPTPGYFTSRIQVMHELSEQLTTLTRERDEAIAKETKTAELLFKLKDLIQDHFK